MATYRSRNHRWGTILIVICVLRVINHSPVHADAAEEEHQLEHRMKRFLIYNINGGVMKNVLGILLPVQFGDNSKRSLNLGYNFQTQYLLPGDPLTIFNSPFFTGFVGRNGRSVAPAATPDDSRLFMYSMLETTWERRGRDGRQCLLRAICEVAESPFAHNGMFGEIVDTIFTPHSEDEHFGRGTAFEEAREAGLHGAHCEKTYWKCPPGQGFLDSISHFFEQ